MENRSYTPTHPLSPVQVILFSLWAYSCPQEEPWFTRCGLAEREDSCAWERGMKIPGREKNSDVLAMKGTGDSKPLRLVMVATCQWVGHSDRLHIWNACDRNKPGLAWNWDRALVTTATYLQHPLLWGMGPRHVKPDRIGSCCWEH